MAVDTQGYFSVIDTFKPPALTVTPELKYILLLILFFLYSLLLPRRAQHLSKLSVVTDLVAPAALPRPGENLRALPDFGQSCRSHQPSDRASGFTQVSESPPQ